MIRVMWHYGGRGSWCHEIAEWLTRGCEHHMGLQPANNAIVIVKADSIPSVHQLDSDLAQFERGVLIVTGNEEGTFQTVEISHPHMKIWLQTPAWNQDAHRYLPWGWTPLEPDLGRRSSEERLFDWSLAGQVTHERRKQCVAAAKNIKLGYLQETDGFAKGLARDVYFDLLRDTKLALCPSGPITVDSFRVCEALECGAIPIVDSVSPTGHYRAYWTRVFGSNIPFPVISHWDCLPALMDVWLDGWEGRAEIVQSWWRAKKAEWLHQLAEDIHG